MYFSDLLAEGQAQAQAASRDPRVVGARSGPVEAGPFVVDRNDDFVAVLPYLEGDHSVAMPLGVPQEVRQRLRDQGRLHLDEATSPRLEQLPGEPLPLERASGEILERHTADLEVAEVEARLGQQLTDHLVHLTELAFELFEGARVQVSLAGELDEDPHVPERSA